MDSTASRQLEVLRQIATVLSRLRVRFWLRGGWGLDFRLGRITRPHADLDLVAWQRQRRRIQRALVAEGFRLERELPVQTDLVKDGQDVTIVFLERAPDGSIAGHGAPDWVWRPDALPVRRHCLGGVSARVVATKQMLDDQESYQEATGRPPRPRDAQTKRDLRAIVRRG